MRTSNWAIVALLVVTAISVFALANRLINEAVSCTYFRVCSTGTMEMLLLALLGGVALIAAILIRRLR